jgi:signal transduction histidine kinase
LAEASKVGKALKYNAYTDIEKTSDVDKEYKPLPLVTCTSDINQAWTNFISNAHDAIMEGKKPDERGRIIVRTARENGFVKVQVTDNGGGISDAIKSKVFDPFFTTKDIGKGTGLGLSIVSGIISKHGGTIDIDSAPGKTTFTVRLPSKKPGKDNKL